MEAQMFFKQFSLLNKMLLVFFFIILGMTSIIAITSYWITARSVEKELTIANLALLSSISDKVDLFAEEIDGMADMIYLNKDVQEALRTTDESDRYRLEYVIKELWSQQRLMFGTVKYQINIYSLKDAYQFTVRSTETITEKLIPFSEIQSLEWYDSLVNKRVLQQWLTEKDVFESEGHRYFTLARPLNDLREHRTTGLLLMSIDEDILRTLYRNALRQSSQIMILNKEGQLISDATEEVRDESKIKSLAQRMGSAASGYLIEEWNEQKSIVLYYQNEKTGWYIVQNIPLPFLLNFLETIKSWIVVVSLLCVVMAISLSYWMSRRIYRPMFKLKDSMKLVETGMLATPSVDTSRHDEIGVLNRGFVRMIDETRLLLNRLVEEEKMKRQLELASLHAQINHHFLYNTLSTIRGMIYLGNPESANAMIIALVKLLKRTLNTKEELIAVEDEIENVKNYTLIQQHRFPGFSIRFEVEEETRSLKILKLILQPLVENAILHGFKAHEDGNGIIEVRIQQRDQVLRIEIEDDGIGMDEETCMELFTPNKHTGDSGIGVSNVQERIQLHYGSRYQVTISSTQGKGTIVTLTLPIIM
jgi:two-component system sensor histidine kinase YesM